MGLIDLAGLGGVLKAIFLLYWLLAIGLLGLAAVKPKTRLGKGLWVASVLAVFGYLPVKAVWQSRQARKAYEAREERHLNAYFLFQEHCKNAGVKIHRTVEGVEGVYLMKVRSPVGCAMRTRNGVSAHACWFVPGIVEWCTLRLSVCLLTALGLGMIGLC